MSSKTAGEIRPEIDSEVLAYALMGISHFLGLNWGLFQDYPTDVEKVVESLMRIISPGISADPVEMAEPIPMEFPISIGRLTTARWLFRHTYPNRRNLEDLRLKIKGSGHFGLLEGCVDQNCTRTQPQIL